MRALNRACVAENDARRAVHGGEWNFCRAQQGGHRCLRPAGHAGTVHVSTANGARDVQVKWTMDGEVLP